jgi:hypothetical protein
MSFDNLPRELQIYVFKHFDMDTRIKTGIINKLKVPEGLINKLKKYIANRTSNKLLGKTMVLVTLPIAPMKNYKCYFEGTSLSHNHNHNHVFWFFVNEGRVANMVGLPSPSVTLLFPKPKSFK